ncbi:RNA polymerase II transcription factor SIII, subunit A [Metarhizium album ARSEF 1941]|uniref:RNA polymerase II transcription factor SIII, subunit A n=1 Tax=Metarhizium album (strain ARSEF 1941) TaxID=1081103 RepID=A0A0B2WN10_METAS|nr:RNA polymerase II transcription factor SIII, subunit A [Metarhizium album ARSEF 1941]KHN95298.1 RNA polymerase II transcription factor SIII, subunit A [Metarhizium album ARSEF 1941]
MPVKSLFELATAACLKNLRELGSIGDYLPYDAVRHLLLKIESAHQLRQIELSSPQIQGQTGEIWLKLIEKDFPLEYKAKAYKPQNPDKWYRVWEKYKSDHDSALEESENKLKNALAGLKQDKEKNTSRIIERKLLPKSVKLGGSRKLFSGPREAHSNYLSLNSGSRTKTVNGASVMRKVRREVKEIATIHGALSRTIRAPTQRLQMSKAPQSLVNDYRRAAQPQYRSSALSPELPSAVAEHEERATFISDSEEDEEGNGDLSDGDEMAKMPPPKQAKKFVVQSAATSLLKRRPNMSPAASSSSTTVKRVSASSTASGPVKNTSGLKSKFNRPAVKSPPASPPKPQSGSVTIRENNSTHQVKTSPPPPPAVSGPSSPPHSESAASRAMPRKRKAVDVFMRPKKR